MRVPAPRRCSMVYGGYGGMACGIVSMSAAAVRRLLSVCWVPRVDGYTVPQGVFVRYRPPRGALLPLSLSTIIYDNLFTDHLYEPPLFIYGISAYMHPIMERIVAREGLVVGLRIRGVCLLSVSRRTRVVSCSVSIPSSPYFYPSCPSSLSSRHRHIHRLPSIFV